MNDITDINHAGGHWTTRDPKVCEIRDARVGYEGFVVVKQGGGRVFIPITAVNYVIYD